MTTLLCKFGVGPVSISGRTWVYWSHMMKQALPIRRFLTLDVLRPPTLSFPKTVETKSLVRELSCVHTSSYLSY